MKQSNAAAYRPVPDPFSIFKNGLAVFFCLLEFTIGAGSVRCATGSFSMSCNILDENPSAIFIEKKGVLLADSCTKIGPSDLKICRPTDPGTSVFVNFNNLILAGDTAGTWVDRDGSGAAGVFPILEFTEVAAGKHSFFYKIKSATAACPDSLFLVEIEVGETPIADAGPDFQLDCFQKNAQLGASGQPDSLIFEWSAHHFGDQPQPETGHPGTYFLKVTDPSNGCFSTDSVIVKASLGRPYFEEIVAAAPRCLGEKNGFIEIKSVVGGMPPLIYSIDNQSFSDNFLFEKLGAGNFSLKIQDAAGCETDTVLTLAEPPVLTLFAGVDTTGFLGDSIQFLPSANFLVDSFFWVGPGVPAKNWQPKIELLTDQKFKLTAFDPNGCRAESGFSVKVSRELPVFFPNIFSPGSGGADAFFCPKMDERRAIDLRHFLIKNRWGELVFSSENARSACWDGRFRGKICPDGAYFWSAEIVLADGTVELRVGDVTLVR